MIKIDIKSTIKLFLITISLSFTNSYADSVLDQELLTCVLQKDASCVQQKLDIGAAPDYVVNVQGTTTLMFLLTLNTMINTL
jgi:hypothetical protein